MMTGRYPIPWKAVYQILFAIIFNRHLAFHKIAKLCLGYLKNPLIVRGNENIPTNGPCLLVTNHYTKPGFRSWWITLAISSVVNSQIAWIMTSEWTSPKKLYTWIITPITHIIFQRIADIFGFFTFPPMPPRLKDVQSRATSVRRLLKYIKYTDHPIIGLAPEGQDQSNGGLQAPPKGVGRFIGHISQLGLNIIPVCIYEIGDQLFLNFGSLYPLKYVNNTDPDEKDRIISHIVMKSIADLLPQELRGRY